MFPTPLRAHDPPTPLRSSAQLRTMPAYPFYDPETGSLVYHVVPDHACGTESISDITSETESSASGLTIASEDVLDFFVDHHGRQQPASENALRWFPADNTKRFILRYIIFKYLFGNNYVGPVREMLRSRPTWEPPCQVLEIGTRDGTWTQEMATEFPHVQFRSWDIAPIIAHTPRANIVFEVYDIADGLYLEDNSQDIVFINVAITLVRDYRALLREIHRVLRPGGLIHIREIAPGFHDSQDDSKLATRTNPIGCHLLDIVRSAVSKLGVDLDLGEKLPSWLAPDSDLWGDSGQPRGFERINKITKTCPVYPHDGHPCSAKIDPRIAPLMGHLSAVSIRDSFGLLRDEGMSEEEANSMVEAAIDEWKDPEKCPLLKFYYVYATKRG